MDYTSVEEMRERIEEIEDVAEEHAILSEMVYLIDEGFIEMDEDGRLFHIDDAEGLCL